MNLHCAITLIGQEHLKVVHCVCFDSVRFFIERKFCAVLHETIFIDFFGNSTMPTPLKGPKKNAKAAAGATADPNADNIEHGDAMETEEDPSVMYEDEEGAPQYQFAFHHPDKNSN